MIVFIQIIAVLVNIYIAFTKKKNVYIATCIFNTVNLLVYIYLKDTTSIVSYTLICVRSLTYIFKDKINLRIIPLIFIALHIVLGFNTLSNYIQLLSILAPCITCCYMWVSKNEQQLRVGNIIVNSIWLLYNSILGLWGLVIARIITIYANVTSLVLNRGGKKNDK